MARLFDVGWLMTSSWWCSSSTVASQRQLCRRPQLRVARPLRPRLPNHVDVLGRPAQPYPRATSGKPPAQRLVGVGDEDRHPDVAVEQHDDLGRGAEVDRALDDPLDRGTAGWHRAGVLVDLQLLRADVRVAALADGEYAGD